MQTNKVLPWPARYFTMIVNGVFLLYLFGCGLMLWETWRAEAWVPQTMAAVVFFCVGSFVRWLLIFFISALARLWMTVHFPDER